MSENHAAFFRKISICSITPGLTGIRTVLRFCLRPGGEKGFGVPDGFGAIGNMNWMTEVAKYRDVDLDAK